MKKEGMAEWELPLKYYLRVKDNQLFSSGMYTPLNGAFKHMMNQAILSDMDPAKFGEFVENMPNGWDGRGILNLSLVQIKIYFLFK